MGGLPDPDPELVLPEPLLRYPTGLLVYLVREARRIGARVHEDDLRLPQVTVLACLDEFGPAAQRDISRRTGVDASDLVSVLDDLEGRGLVRRTRDERDRRRYMVTITEDGGRALRRRLVSVQQVNDLLLAPLDEDERARLLELLLRVYAHHDPSRVPVELLGHITV